VRERNGDEAVATIRADRHVGMLVMVQGAA
jgi:hypothetical protein